MQTAANTPHPPAKRSRQPAETSGQKKGRKEFGCHPLFSTILMCFLGPEPPKKTVRPTSRGVFSPTGEAGAEGHTVAVGAGPGSAELFGVAADARGPQGHSAVCVLPRLPPRVLASCQARCVASEGQRSRTHCGAARGCYFSVILCSGGRGRVICRGAAAGTGSSRTCGNGVSRRAWGRHALDSGRAQELQTQRLQKKTRKKRHHIIYIYKLHGVWCASHGL